MPDASDITRLRTDRDAALARAIAAEDRVSALDRQIAQAHRSGDQRMLGQAREQRADAAGNAKEARGAHAKLQESAFNGLSVLLQQTPEAIVGKFSDQRPIVLLPVRLETKYASSQRGIELRVRIFPDDISIAAPPSAVTDEELADAEAYWRARVDAHAHPQDADRQRAYQGAWMALATRHGAYRAGYIVTAMTPVDIGAAPDALVFNPPAVPAEPPVPRADALPDRFVILTYSAGRQIHEVVGRPIPDDLALAPNAAQSDTWLARDRATGKMSVPAALRWLVDFDAAVDVGMGVRIALQAPFDTTGFDRLVAIGVRSATPPDEGTANLERLLAKHRYGNGCGVVRAGTPTNNTDSAISGWQPASSDTDQLFTIADAPPDILPRPGVLGISDGWRLVELLGLSTEFARCLPNAASTDIAEAIAMNRAAAPGTLDDFVGEFLKTVVLPDTATALHGFFVNWVSGRGLYPALRVGREPYGIVVTSAWDRWAYPDADVPLPLGRDVAPQLAAMLRVHRPRWTMLGAGAAHAGQPAADPFQRLVTIIGLLASSSDFVSRKAVSDDYVRQRLRFGGAQVPAIQRWFDQLTRLRDASLAASGIPNGPGPVDPLIAFITFLDHTDAWRLPIVDRDPKVPLSERDTIGPFDGTRNYLQWLAQASRSDIVGQRFIGVDGTSVAAPTALLYVLLRYSLLAALESGALETATTFGRALFDVVDRDPPIANIGTEQHVLRRDYLEVDAAQLGLADTPMALVDWALINARAPGAKPGPVARVAEVHDAITALADMPTARLERLLAEHIDLCAYRLDAWITALYTQRLAQLRSQEGNRGLYLGAYGWVENLRPTTAARQQVSADTLPPALRSSASETIYEDANNGGFIHAPSLMQAATASVLRNAYLSHASPTQPMPFAVNLSSARMRAAIELTEGVRNGQAIAALLGYQIERGLHESHPDIELDQYIYVLRDRFPLVSGQLTELPPDTSAAVTEARNVVHGLDLIEFTAGKTFPWGIAGLPAAGSAASNAMVAEVEHGRDSLDAVSDLLLSESVHQAVQGNVARTKASLQALTEPEAPPEPEVVRTPRSGSVFTFRIALALDVDAVGGWSAGLSPRARANPQLNHWLADHLPAPDAIQWSVTDGGAAPRMQSLAALGFEPIDVVLMSGDRLGDRSSELERLLIRHYRWKHNVPDERITVVAPATGPIDPAKTLLFDFSASDAAKRSLATMQPLLARLRRIITRARAADARDFWRAADMVRADATDPTGSASGDPRLVAFKDLTTRLDTGINGLTAATAAIKAKLLLIAPLRTTLENDPTTVSDPAWPAMLDSLRTALYGAVPFGIPEALSADGMTVSRTLIDTLIAQSQAVAKLCDQRLAQAQSLSATAFADPLPVDEPERSKEIARRSDRLQQNYVECARALFGPAFGIVPMFRLHADQANEIAQAMATPPPADALALEEWTHSAARVRPRLAELTWAMAATRWVERAIADPSLLQLPYRPGTPWVGGKVGTDQARGEWLSLVVLDSAALAKPVRAALMIDDWTETVPTNRETTGVSFNFNRPNAVAPHAILAAVAPVLRGNWEWADLVGAVNEALDLAKVRAVEPDQLLDRDPGEGAPHGDYFQALPAILSEFSTVRFANVHLAATATAVTKLV
jgi:hypothetical protein